MHWGCHSPALFLWLLFVNSEGIYSSEIAREAPLQGKTAGVSHRQLRLTSSPAAESERKEGNGAKEKELASLEVGLLSDNIAEEKEMIHGVLERIRNEAVARDLNISDASPEQGRKDPGEARDQNKEEQNRQCSPGCRKGWLGDGWCDTACNTEACDFDSGDCAEWCSGDCKPGWQGDGFCDLSCYVAACDWDGGDCSAWKDKGVQPVERRTLQQKQKQLKQHRLQLPRCKCERRLLVNGSCTPECNVPECLFDGGECLDMCNAKCSRSWLGDGDCDRECDTAECAHDKGDCDSSTNASMIAMREANGNTDVCNSSCRLWMIGNGVCDNQCNNVTCGYDAGDCDNVTAVLEVDYSAKPEVYQFCAKEWIGDGHCDPNCYNKSSKWDGGDCEGTQLEREQAEKGIGPQFED